MNFEVGHDLEVDGATYLILGSIAYKNREGEAWEEYRLRKADDRTEWWLSFDTGNNEYELSYMVGTSQPPQGYTRVDLGTQIVQGRHGNVDVDLRESAQYETWEDQSGRNTYSVEYWSDETEHSVGRYVRLETIRDLGMSPNAKEAKKGGSRGGCLIPFFVLTGICVLISAIGGTSTSTTNISSSIASSINYTLVTDAPSDHSESDESELATYSTTLTVESAAKDIISMADGDVSSVRENDDGKTVAIMTPNEYVLVYEDAGEEGEAQTEEVAGDTQTPSTGTEEATTEASAQETSSESSAETTETTTTEETTEQTEDDDTGKTLVQVSNRYHAYTTDQRPYHSSYRSYHWYRRYYRAVGYSQDTSSYGSAESSYSSYNGETTIDSSTVSQYETYANSIRSTSTSSKTTSGGGTSHGK